MLPALYHNRMTRPEARRRARELLEEIGYRGGLSKLPAFLGIQQRLQLAIARATILEPAVLFVELPFINLSLAEQEPIFHYLRNCHRQRALVVATHNLRLVQTAATQILFLGKGRAWHFTCWQALTQHDDEELNHYLSLYRQQYQPT
jgi:ABC-type lipoprotein export system ATPase subunit